MLGLDAGNFFAWMAQVIIIATLGAALPVVFRIRHARSRLIYCHAVLAATLVLPTLQPWQDSLVFTRNAGVAPPVSSPQQKPGVDWQSLAAVALAIGVAIRLGWLAVGVHQIRRYRQSAVPLIPVPESIRAARHLARADSSFRLSKTLTGPATLGHVDPVILLPHSFLSLSEDAQRAVAVHELLHVRRRDWLTTVMEELLTCFMWFNPGIWWLVSQSRLSREELVDAEVIELTAAPEPYINALLSIAGAPATVRLAPAALLLTKRHLAQRMRSLCLSAKSSISKLALSYGAMAIILSAGVGSSFTWFPLMGNTDAIVVSSEHLRPPLVKFFEPANVRKMQFFFKISPGSLPETKMMGSLASPIPLEESPGDVLFVLSKLQDVGTMAKGTAVHREEGFAAVRAIRPGDVMLPEDIKFILSTVPPGTVEITQDATHTVTRVIIGRQNLRRAVHEIDTVAFDVPLGSVHTDTTTPAIPADRID